MVASPFVALNTNLSSPEKPLITINELKFTRIHTAFQKIMHVISPVSFVAHANSARVQEKGLEWGCLVL